MVVGEAPGRVEVDTGVPFTGPSGILLDKVFGHYRIDREKVRYTNVVACHPPYGGAGTSVTPPASVIAACSGRLKRELAGREQVLLLGNTAKAAVTGATTPITRYRVGPPKLLASGTEVVATVHPAACLRQSDMFPFLVRDVNKLVNTDLFRRWTPPTYREYDTINEALQVISELWSFPLLVLDIETDVEKDVSFTHPEAILCIGISYAPNKAIVLGEHCLRDSRVRRALKELIHAKRIVCHNGKYDLQVLLRDGVIDFPVLYADTMLASYVLDERPGNHSLANCASEYLGAPDWKSDVAPYTEGGRSYRNIPTPLLHKYNAWDAAQTFLLWQYFEAKLEREGLRRVHDMLVGFSTECIYIEYDGICVDEDYLKALETKYLGKIDELNKQLAPWVENARSWQQVQAALEKLGERVVSTNFESLTNIQRRASGELAQFVALMMQHRRLGKLYGTYVKGVLKRTMGGRVYPSYLFHGTVFGRLASRNPNIQNVVRDPEFRKVYVPAPGRVFVQADLGAAELRVVACEARDPYLIEVFNDPTRNIHDEVSDTLYGAGCWNKEQRVRTKAFVFGSTYGREHFSIAQEFDMPLWEAERIQKGFFAMIPETMAWRQQVQDQVFKEGRALQTHFGRKRRFHLITRENRGDVAKESLAFVPQSSASDICQYATMRIRRNLGWSVDGPRIRNTVHDSILVDCDPADAVEIGNMMSDVLRQTALDVYSDVVPFEADWETGPSWGELAKP